MPPESNTTGVCSASVSLLGLRFFSFLCFDVFNRLDRSWTLLSLFPPEADSVSTRASSSLAQLNRLVKTWLSAQ